MTSTGGETLGNIVDGRVINQYICAIRILVGEQYENGISTLSHANLMINNIKNLVNNVSNRGERLLKEQNKERLGKNKKYTSKNTSKYYNKKKSEFQHYLTCMYESESLITTENVFGFLYYQAHREKKTKRKRK